MLGRRYCETCKEWVITGENNKCPKCHSDTFEVRRITNPEEVRKLITVREPHKAHEEEIINMIAESGAILEGHFILEDD